MGNESFDGPDDALTDEEQAIVAGLSAAQIEAVDAALLAAAEPRWQKVAFIVASVWRRDEPRLPLAFLVRRVMDLVQQGKLESQGNLQRMRFSEVRLPSPTRRRLSSVS